MIEIPQPSIVLNSHDVPPPTYSMWETWNVSASESAEWIAAKVSLLATGAGEPMKCLVINCHGNYDYGIDRSGKRMKKSVGGFGLEIGMGLRHYNIHHFFQIHGLFKCIVVIACQAARYTYNAGSLKGNGRYFISQLARYSGAYVIAPVRTQWSAARQVPQNHIDKFEGAVLKYGPTGLLHERSLIGRKLIRDVFR